MKNYLGLPVHNLELAEISDDDLLKQIVTLSRVYYFVCDADRKWEINPKIMRDNYGDLLCDENLQNLIDEASRRSENGSQRCAEFLKIADEIISTRHGIVRNDDGFTNSANRIASHPAIKTKYYGRIVYTGGEAPHVPQTPLRGVELGGLNS